MNLSSFLPQAISEHYRRYLEITEMGYSTSLWNFLDIRRTYISAHEAGLNLIPPNSLSKIDYVVDIGSNDGSWMKKVLDCTSVEDGVMIEPNPEVFKIVSDKADKWRIDAMNVAVGEEAGEVELKINKEDKISSVMEMDKDAKKIFGDISKIKKTKKVKKCPIDGLSLGFPEISLLKIDVQGLEESVIMGAEKTLDKTRMVMVEMNYFVQYQGGSNFADVHRALTEENDFQLYDVSKPVIMDGRAVYSDAVYKNPRL